MKGDKSAAVIIAALEKAAASGAPCPSNRELAHAAGVTEANAGRTVLRLVRGGVLRIERPKVNRRIIEIAGKRTGIGGGLVTAKLSIPVRRSNPQPLPRRTPAAADRAFEAAMAARQR